MLSKKDQEKISQSRKLTNKGKSQVNGKCFQADQKNGKRIYN